MKNNVILFGCGGHARSIADVLLTINSNIKIIFLDPNAQKNEKILHFDVLKKYEITDEAVFPAIGNNIERKKIIEKYYDNVINIISPHAYVSKSAIIGKGVFIAHNSHIGTYSQILDGVIINTAASIDHENIIDKYTHIAPNATLCGRVTTGCNCLVGAGSTIIDKVSITDDIIIGAGSLVLKNITEKGTYAGSPARKIK